MTNFEFKARLRTAHQVQSVMQQCGAEVISLMRQTDTYFHVAQGRLKLREISFLPTANASDALPAPRAELIFYQRPDEAGVKRSEYMIASVAEVASLRALLQAALGVRVVVEKRRELYLLGYFSKPHAPRAPHIRVHLDQVERLGSFVEVEAVMGEGITAEQAQAEAQRLLNAFGVPPQDLIHGSYSDLLERSEGAEV